MQFVELLRGLRVTVYVTFFLQVLKFKRNVGRGRNKPAKKGVSNEATKEAEHEGGTKEVGDRISRGSIP